MLLYAYKHNGGTKFDVVTALPTSPDGYSHQLLNSMRISAGLVLCLYSYVTWLNSKMNVTCRWAQELRFYCTTSHHKRVIHFKTSNRNIILTAYDGKKHFSASDWRFFLVNS